MKRGVGFLLGAGALLGVAMAPAQTGSYLGVQAVYAEASARSVGTFAELLAAFDATDEADEGEMVITLTSDIEQGYEAGDYLGVNAGWTVTLDLAGHKLTLRNDGPRGLQNRGTLTITGNGTITNSTSETMNEAYGLVDNYGTLVVENGTFIDYGQGGGSVLKNRPGGVMSVSGATITAYGTAGGNACVASDGTLSVADGVEMVNYSTDEKHNGYYGAYALIINSGTATIGTTVGEIENPVRVNGNRGAICVNSGVAVINNGEYHGGEYYGFWITNNGNVSNVTIKYAEIYGKRYGVYAAVDDGRQDLSDVGVRIEGGKYYGNTKAAVAVNNSHSENSFGMAIAGGEFSTAPDVSYLAEDYTIYTTRSETHPYAVDEVTEVELPETVYLSVGETYELPVTNLAKRYLEAGNALDGEQVIVSFDQDTWTYTAVASGTGLANYKLHNYIGEEVDDNINFVVVAPEDVEVKVGDDTESEIEEETVDFVTKQIETLLEGGASNNEYMEIDLDAMKEAIGNGETLTVVVEGHDEGEVSEDVAGLLEGREVLGVYSRAMVIYNESGNDIGVIHRLEKPVTLTFVIPEEYRKAPKGFERTFYVVREHQGEEPKMVKAVFDGENAVIENDKFSTFVVTYEDTEIVETPNTGAFTELEHSVERLSGVMRLSVGMLATGMMLVGAGLIMRGRAYIERNNNLDK